MFFLCLFVVMAALFISVLISQGAKTKPHNELLDSKISPFSGDQGTQKKGMPALSDDTVFFKTKKKVSLS